MKKKFEWALWAGVAARNGKQFSHQLNICNGLDRKVLSSLITKWMDQIEQ